MRLTFLYIIINVVFFFSCDDYSTIRNEIIVQTKLIADTTKAIKSADSFRSATQILRSFNDAMIVHHANFAEKQKKIKTNKPWLTNPPRSLQNEVQNLEQAISTFRETLSATFLFCDDANLRRALITTANLLEKTLQQ